MIKSLEGARGIAALVVALYHLKIGADYFSAVRNGYLFVDLFFVLSGFVICAAYAQRMNGAADFRSFIIRRVGRLLPLLLFSTVIYLLLANAIVLAKRVATALGHQGLLHHPGTLDFVVPSLSEVFSTMTMTHGMGLFDHLILNTPSWSISTEFYTYLLFAAACLLAGRMRWPVFALLVVCGFTISLLVSIDAYDCLAQGGCLSLTYDFGFPRTVFSFFLGAMTWRASRSLRTNSALLQLVGACALLLLFAAVDAHPGLAFAFPFAFSLLILSLCGDRGWLARLLSCAPFQLLGERSYSIYLLHMPLVLLFENLAARADTAFGRVAVLAVYVTALVIVSGYTYRLVEDPFRTMFNRIAARRVISGTPAN